MTIKRFVIPALIIMMGAFLLSVSAFAAVDTAPPTVKASIAGNTLTVVATDTGSGVEAVYINRDRFNYSVDSALAIDARGYDGAQIAIYAVDFAGNQSDELLMDNPFYVQPSISPNPTPDNSPTITQANPFTPSGQGSVLDQATQSDGKDFYTFKTPNGNVFYLVIDHQKNGDNVYFLNAVTENDLMSLAGQSGSKSTDPTGNTGNSILPTTPTPSPSPAPPTVSPVESTPAPSKEPPAKSSPPTLLIVIAVLAAGGAGYYFKVVRPKKRAANGAGDDVPEDDEDEMAFEDDPDNYNTREDNDNK